MLCSAMPGRFPAASELPDLECALQERAEIESELRPMSAGELFSIPKEGCELGDGCDVGDLLSA